MVLGAKVCELFVVCMWFVCGNFDISPYSCVGYFRCQFLSLGPQETTSWPIVLYILSLSNRIMVKGVLFFILFQ